MKLSLKLDLKLEQNVTIVSAEANPAADWATQSHYIHYVQVQYGANLAHQYCPFLPPGEEEGERCPA